MTTKPIIEWQRMRENGKEHLGSIVCLGGSHESLPIIQKVMEMGYRPIVLDGNENCVASLYANALRSEKSYWNKQPVVFIKANCYNYLSCAQALLWAVRKERRRYDDGFFNLEDLVGVLCCAIDAPMVAAQLAEKYRLPTIGSNAARYGVNKFYQWQRLESNNIPVPTTRIVNPEMGWEEVSDYNLIKPVDSRGARGVRFYDESNYREAFAEALSWSKERSVVAQKFIPGVQLSTESIVYDGYVDMTSVVQRNYDRLHEFSPYIIEDGCDSTEPSSLNYNINLLIERCCRVLGWNNCTVKGDLVLDENLLYVLELAPRLSGGFFSSHITPLSMGWDLVGDAIRLATGSKSALHFEPSRGFISQRYIFPKSDWIGKRIVKVPEFPSAVSFGTWNVKVGDVIQRVQHHPSRIGQVIVVGETNVDAANKAVEIVKELTERIEVE